MKNKLQKWASAYNMSFPRSIVYMLQASEYKFVDYIKWLSQLKSFKNIEVRKHLVKTQKSTLILAVAWTISACVFGLALYISFSQQSLISYIFALFILILYPYILEYGIIIPLFLIKLLVQSPIEYFIIKKAKEKLKKHKAFKIAIAGSFGKTTMREILKTVIAENKKVAAPLHNHNTLLGISDFIKNLKGDEEVLVFELGEYYKGDILEMCELVNPDLGIITGVNEAHLEKFKNLSVTKETIFELADWIKEKPVYINEENLLAKQGARGDDVLYSRKGVGSLIVENASTGLNGTFFTLTKEGEKFEFKSNLLGLHQVGPLCAAIHIAMSLGIPIEKIIKGVEKTKPFDHRLEPKINDGVVLLDDSYNGNPDGVRAVIEFFESLRGHRRIYVTPGLVEMGSRAELVHKEIGENLAKAQIEKVILIKNSVTQYIEQGLKNSSYKGEILWFNDGLSALNALPHLTVTGDVVLLQNDWPDQYY